MSNSRFLKINRRTLKVEMENYLAMTIGFEKVVENREVNIKSTIFTTRPFATAIDNSLEREPQLLTLSRTTSRAYHRNKDILSKLRYNYMKLEYDTVIRDQCFKSYDRFKEYLFNNAVYKYVVFIDTIYYIEKNYIKQFFLWNDLCTNGLFEQWNWSAPFASYLNVNIPPEVNELLKKLIRSGDINAFPEDKFMKYFTHKPMILLLRIYEINRRFNYNNLFYYNNRYKQSTKFDVIMNENDCITMLLEPIIPNDTFEKTQDTLEKAIKNSGMDIKKRKITYTDCWL